MSPIPANLNRPEFLELWADWQQHRREMRKPLTPTAAKRQLAKLSGWGLARAVAAMEHSIANGWQGIFEERSAANEADLFAGPAAWLHDREEVG